MNRHEAVNRYESMFARCEGGAFVPFVMLGDPHPHDVLEIVRALVAAGADALELGIPFSDPVADGPTIQASHLRAMGAGATVEQAFEQIRKIRAEFPELPIGLLVYGNLIFARESFYADAAAAGADSVLVPDIPVREGEPFARRAIDAGVEPIFIAPARASEQTLEGVARLSKGYIYAISRDGVTGTESEATSLGLDEIVANVQRFGGPPVLLGFGISEPQHVCEAVAAGAAGAITGSAITKIIEKHLDGSDTPRVRDMPALTAELREYVGAMKAAAK